MGAETAGSVDITIAADGPGALTLLWLSRRVRFQNHGGNRRQENLFPGTISNDIHIVSARLEDFDKLAKRVPALVDDFESKQLVQVKLTIRQAGDVTRFDVHPLIAKGYSIFRGFHAFEFDQHPFCMWARARKGHGLKFSSDEEVSAALQALREVGMQIHNDFPAHAMRPAKKTDC